MAPPTMSTNTLLRTYRRHGQCSPVDVSPGRAPAEGRDDVWNPIIRNKNNDNQVGGPANLADLPTLRRRSGGVGAASRSRRPHGCSAISVTFPTHHQTSTGYA